MKMTLLHLSTMKTMEMRMIAQMNVNTCKCTNKEQCIYSYSCGHQWYVVSSEVIIHQLVQPRIKITNKGTIIARVVTTSGMYVVQYCNQLVQPRIKIRNKEHQCIQSGDYQWYVHQLVQPRINKERQCISQSSDYTSGMQFFNCEIIIHQLVQPRIKSHGIHPYNIVISILTKITKHMHSVLLEITQIMTALIMNSI